MIGLGLLSIFSVTLVLTTIRDAKAIPAWSRKYGVECSTCHYPAVPRLNTFGQKFRWAGYRFPEEFNQEQDVTKVGEFLSARARVRAEYENKSQEIERTEFTFHDATLFYSGAFTRNFSGFLELEFEPEDDGVETSLVGQLQGIYGEADGFFAFRVGQIHWLQRVGVGGFDRPTGISTTPLYSATLTNSGLNFKISEDQKGIELAYTSGQHRLLGQVLNGVDENGSGTEKNFDIDPEKDYLVAYEHLLDDIASGFTVFYYHGTTHEEFDEGPPAKISDKVNFTRVGANLSKIFPLGPVNLEFQGGYVRSYDNLPKKLGKNVQGNAFYVESQQLLTGPDITFLERYSLIDLNDDQQGTNRHDITAGVVTPVQTWLRLAAEYTYTDNNAVNQTDHSATIELMANW
jgi:hypothetical protein